MKAYTDTDAVIALAKALLDDIDQLDSALYGLDGEIPNDDANRAVGEARQDLREVMKSVGYLASGMWRARTPSEKPDQPSHWGCGKHGVIFPVGSNCVECVVDHAKSVPFDECPW